jgi:hypothetical protein
MFSADDEELAVQMLFGICSKHLTEIGGQIIGSDTVRCKRPLAFRGHSGNLS